MQAVMRVVVPLCVVGLRVVRAPEQVRGVVEILEQQVHRPVGAGSGAHCVGDVAQDVRFARVVDRVHCVEAQTVEVILLQPIKRIVDQEVAHLVPLSGPSKIEGPRPRACCSGR